MMVTTFFKWIRDTWFIPGQEAMNIGFNISLLSFGSGLLVGFRICLAMAIGTAISWFILPHFLFARGHDHRLDLSGHVALGDVAGHRVDGGGRFDLARAQVEFDCKDFSRAESSRMGQRDFPMVWVVIGGVVMTVVLCVLQYFSMGIPMYLSLIAILLSLPLMLVGLRVLGETNWGPISAMSNMMQAVFVSFLPAMFR
jgi:hypothetical protein